MRLLAIAFALGLAACSGRCPPPAAAGQAGAEATDPDLVSRAERLAKAVCDCPSAMCADARAADYVDLLAERDAALAEATARRLLEVSREVLSCRVRLAYPSDPVDMDGAGEDSEGPEPAPASDGG